jgi:hypothetical protein
MVALAVSGIWAYAQRKWLSGPGGWWHSDAGHIVITAVGVLVSAITPIVQSYHGGFHGFPWVALCWAAVGGLLNALAAANASVPMGEKAPMHPGAKMLLPFLLLGTLAISGCVGATALGRCELGHLPQTLQSLIAAVASIASQPGNYVEDLTQLGIQVGPEQVDCVAAAIAAEASKPKGTHHPMLTMTRDHLNEYLATRRARGANLKCPPVYERAVATGSWVPAGPPGPLERAERIEHEVRVDGEL